MLLGRRELLVGAGASLALASSARLLAAPVAGFTHGIASGEPTMHSVLLWTRYRGRGGAVALKAEIASDPGFRKIARVGTALATPDADWTARVTLDGLDSGRAWYYRFTAPDGTRSQVGRTATLPDGLATRFTIGVFSCANLPFGWFNAYGHAAASPEIDVVAHVGDYIYEYARGIYPSPEATLRPGAIDPNGAANTLAAYRERYASYRRDPDLRALHAAKPWLIVWDDHEFADNAARENAYGHDAKTEGAWIIRQAAARRAWLEWMPVSVSGWSSRDVGALGSLISIDTRTERDEPADFYAIAKPAEGLRGRLEHFRDDTWSDETVRMLGKAQEDWLTDELRAAPRRTRWQVLIQSVPMGYSAMPAQALNWTPRGGAESKSEVELLVELGRVGVPMNMDNWNGYPAQRRRILKAAQAADAKLIVLSGDSHNAWSYRLMEGGRPAGLELAAPSVTSPGFESWFPGEDAERVASALVDANPELLWADTSRRGYGRVVLTPNHAQLEWWFTNSIARRMPSATLAHHIEHGA